MDEDQILARLDGEGAAANLALVDYATLPVADRSLRKLHQRYVEQQASDQRPPTARLPTLEKWSKQFKWQERIKQIDDLRRRLRLDAEAEERREMNERHIKTAQDTLKLVETWLKTGKLDKPRDVLAAIKVSAELERKARGIPDTLLALMNLSDEDLMRRHSHLASSVFNPSLLADSGDGDDDDDDEDEDEEPETQP